MAILQTIMAGASLLQAYNNYSAYRDQSTISRMNSRIEEIRGKEQAIAINKMGAETLASQNALFTARGFLNGGTKQAVADNTIQNINNDLSTAHFNSKIKSLNHKRNSIDYKKTANFSLLSGLLDGGNKLMQYKSKTY